MSLNTTSPTTPGLQQQKKETKTWELFLKDPSTDHLSAVLQDKETKTHLTSLLTMAIEEKADTEASSSSHAQTSMSLFQDNHTFAFYELIKQLHFAEPARAQFSTTVPSKTLKPLWENFLKNPSACFITAISHRTRPFLSFVLCCTFIFLQQKLQTFFESKIDTKASMSNQNKHDEKDQAKCLVLAVCSQQLLLVNWVIDVLFTDKEEEVSTGKKAESIKKIIGAVGKNALDKQKHLLMHYAVQTGELKIVESILGLKYINFSDKTDSKGERPIHLAARLGYTDIVDRIIQHNPKERRNLLTKNQHTFLDLLIKSKSETFDMRVAKRTKFFRGKITKKFSRELRAIEAPSEMQQLALQYCDVYGSLESLRRPKPSIDVIIKSFKDYFANQDFGPFWKEYLKEFTRIKNKDDQSAIYLLARHNQSQLLKFLLENDALDPTELCYSKKCYSPFSVACYYLHWETVEYLLTCSPLQRFVKKKIVSAANHDEKKSLPKTIVEDRRDELRKSDKKDDAEKLKKAEKIIQLIETARQLPDLAEEQKKQKEEKQNHSSQKKKKSAAGQKRKDGPKEEEQPQQKRSKTSKQRKTENTKLVVFRPQKRPDDFKGEDWKQIQILQSCVPMGEEKESKEKKKETASSPPPSSNNVQPRKLKKGEKGKIGFWGEYFLYCYLLHRYGLKDQANNSDGVEGEMKENDGKPYFIKMIWYNKKHIHEVMQEIEKKDQGSKQDRRVQLEQKDHDIKIEKYLMSASGKKLKELPDEIEYIEIKTTRQSSICPFFTRNELTFMQQLPKSTSKTRYTLWAVCDAESLTPTLQEIEVKPPLVTSPEFPLVSAKLQMRAAPF